MFRVLLFMISIWVREGVLVFGVEDDLLWVERRISEESEWSLCCCDCYYEEVEDVVIEIYVVFAERHERQVHRVQHQLHAYKQCDGIVMHYHIEDANIKSNGVKDQVLLKSWLEHHLEVFLFTKSSIRFTFRVRSIPIFSSLFIGDAW